MPTDRQQRCKKCGDRFTKLQGTTRVYCFNCRPQRADDVDSKIINANFGPNQDQQGENQDQEGKLTRLSRLRLEELGVLDTWQGAAAMALAELIDTGKGSGMGTGGAAGAIKAHREAMAVAEALSNVDDGDVIDAIFSAQEA